MKKGVKVLCLLIFMSIFTPIILSGCALLPEERVAAPPPLKPPPLPKISKEEVTRGYIASSLKGLARVAAKKEASLYFKRDDRVAEILVDYDQQVEEGDLLVKLETGDLEYQYELARLELKKEELIYNKNKKLKSIGNIISDYEFELSKINYQIKKIGLERFAKQLNQSKIVAPFAGKVTNIGISEGEQIEAYTDIITIANLDELELQLNVSADRLHQIVTGMKAQIQLADGRWLAAKVTGVPSLLAEIAPGQPERRVKLDLLERDKMSELQFDTLLRARIILEEKQDALILPRAVIREYMDRRYVRVLEGESRKDVYIELGIVTETHAEIVNGLVEGQLVIGK